MFFHTGYEEGGLQRDLGTSEAAADTLVVSGVPGLDLCDQQSPVGQQEHSAHRRQINDYSARFNPSDDQSTTNKLRDSF